MRGHGLRVVSAVFFDSFSLIFVDLICGMACFALDDLSVLDDGTRSMAFMRDL